MNTPSAPQRAWRALCPNCGAPVEFHSAASASAVCSFCRSTLVRDGEALRRIGVSAELFDDHSPLRLGAAGQYQGQGFTLVGRLQYRYDEGGWNEWHALFDAGRSGWLSEDNGQYVFVFDVPLDGDVPAAARLTAGERFLIDGRTWQVASQVRASLRAAEGELPRPPQLQGDFAVVDLRNSREEVGTLDYADPARPQWSVGRAVTLAELKMSGLADEAAEQAVGSRAIECPNCGASLEVTLATTKSIACRHCDSVIDVSKGVGADLTHYRQNNAGDSGLEPLLPLGRTGTLALGHGGPLPWQVVGYLERCDVPADADEEQGFWREYLLYHRKEGFAFLVDAEDGWSWVRPLTGAPEVRGSQAHYRGVPYLFRYRYTARTTYVLGEFYWKVERGQQSLNTDYQGSGAQARKRLNREQSGSEVVWSAGETLDAAVLAKAFGLPAAPLVRDVAPAGGGKGGKGLLYLFIAFVLLILFMNWLAEPASSANYSQSAGSSSRCEPYAAAERHANTAYRACFSASQDSRNCESLLTQLQTASAEHQRCIDSNTRSSSGGGSGWRSSSSSGWSWGGGGGHK